MLISLILLLILSKNVMQLAQSSSSSTSSSPQLPSSEYEEREKNAIKELYRLHKAKEPQTNTILSSSNNGKCGSVKNPHTMRCPHWQSLNRQERHKNRARLRLLVIPDRIRLMKNRNAKQNMRNR